MKWFEPIIAVIAILLVLIPIVLYFVKKKKGTLKCECGHYVSECGGSCEACDSKSKNIKKLVYVLSVEGMKCGMCESHINDAIRRNFDVVKVKSSRKTNTTLIETKKLLNIAMVKNTIVELGYSVSSINLK